MPRAHNTDCNTIFSSKVDLPERWLASRKGCCKSCFCCAQNWWHLVGLKPFKWRFYHTREHWGCTSGNEAVVTWLYAADCLYLLLVHHYAQISPRTIICCAAIAVEETYSFCVSLHLAIHCKYDCTMTNQMTSKFSQFS